MARCRVRGPMIRVYLLAAFMATPFYGWGQAPAPAGQQQPPAPLVLQPSTTAASTSSANAGGTIQGVIRSGQTPLPGVTVTAKNTLTGKKYVTATDSRGAFTLEIDEDGRYVVRTEFAAFATLTKEVLLHSGNAAPQTDFALV